MSRPAVHQILERTPSARSDRPIRVRVAEVDGDLLRVVKWRQGPRGDWGEGGPVIELSRAELAAEYAVVYDPTRPGLLSLLLLGPVYLVLAAVRLATTRFRFEMDLDGAWHLMGERWLVAWSTATFTQRRHLPVAFFLGRPGEWARNLWVLALTG